MSEKNKYHKDRMWGGADPETFRLADKLRKHQTFEENIMWAYLRKRPYGLKFRRQHAIGLYIVDFYCHAFKLILEIDGPYHNEPTQKEKDYQREQYFIKRGYDIIRLTNEEVLLDFDTMFHKTKERLRIYIDQKNKIS